MAPMFPHPLAGLFQVLKDSWEDYLNQPGTVQFDEFLEALDSFTEHCKDQKQPGLSRLCESAGHQALTLGGTGSHPMSDGHIASLTRQVETVLSAAAGLIMPPIVPGMAPERRTSLVTESVPATEAPSPDSPLRTIWLVAEPSHPWVAGLSAQLEFFGFDVRLQDWHDVAPAGGSPLVALFIPREGYTEPEIACIAKMRAEHPVSQLFCLGVAESLPPMVALLRAGADLTIPAAEQTGTVLSQVLGLIDLQDQEPYRVLIVEDSVTAAALISRTLSRHGIDNQAINVPDQLLDGVRRFRPDLVLMDMHMPGCTGVEATRVLRQIPAFQSLPVVYLSSETDLGMQVAALQLGGDQFISKPFNPVLLTTIVKTRIERHRAMQRSGQHDGLTGLLNHITSKMRLGQLIQTLDPAFDRLSVVMLDIDRFKSINDVHGHPAGDQVIRNLGWLLKGRLRTTDLIGRYGGEEFLLVLRGIGIEQASQVLERIRIDFSELAHSGAGVVLKATFSGGIAEFPAFRSEGELIAAADQALLRAKAGGRNRIERG